MPKQVSYEALEASFQKKCMEFKGILLQSINKRQRHHFDLQKSFYTSALWGMKQLVYDIEYLDGYRSRWQQFTDHLLYDFEMIRYPDDEI
jgi:hypothetical protein